MMSGCIVMNALRQHGRVAWVAPTYKNTRPMWRWAVTTASPAVKAGRMEINRAERTITTKAGGELALYSGDNIDSIRGEAFNLVILDEAAKLPEGAWTDAIMPTLSDFDGDAVLISTPRGRNWFYNEFMRAQGDGQVAAAWQAPTKDNPLPNIQKAFEMARDRVSDDTFRQEWLAEFVESSGVFRNITACAIMEAQAQALPGHEYIIGVDWAMSKDFTVFTVFDVAERALVWVDRFNQIDYPMQAARLKALAQRFKPSQIVAESNAMGLPIIQQLANDGMPMSAFNTTSGTKDAAIRDLALAFEKGDIRIIPDPALINELQSYEVLRVGQNGVPVYGAPEGMHDDMVMSAAIGWTRLASAWLAW